MSKISVTTIAGLTSGGDANTVKIESGDAFQVVSGATTLGGTASITGNTTVGGTLGVTGATTIDGLTTLNGKFLIDGSNNDLMTFRTTGDTASQVLGLQFQNNSEAVTAQIFGTGDNSSNGVFRIKGIGNVDIVGGDVGVTAAAADLRVASNGIVTMPNQPAFAAVRTAGDTTSITTFVYNSVIYNIGNHYDSSNGRFTAPVAGRYHFNVMMSHNGSGTASIGYFRPQINGSSLNYLFPIGPNIDHYSIGVSFTLNLNASDYVSINTGTTAQILGGGNNHNHFSGFLVG